MNRTPNFRSIRVNAMPQRCPYCGSNDFLRTDIDGMGASDVLLHWRCGDNGCAGEWSEEYKGHELSIDVNHATYADIFNGAVDHGIVFPIDANGTKDEMDLTKKNLILLNLALAQKKAGRPATLQFTPDSNFSPACQMAVIVFDELTDLPIVEHIFDGQVHHFFDLMREE